MNLIDFECFDPLNKLRAQMDTQKLGNFKLINPEIHLTYLQLESLQLNAMDLQGANIRVLADKTLAYKNSRLWIKLERDPITEIPTNEYHLSNCEHVQQYRQKNLPLIAGSSMLVGGRVCGDCLMELKYQGLDARRGRRQGFMESVVETFSLEEFQSSYPFYPLADE